MGGIWPNLTAWIGYAVRKFFPDKVVEAMVNIFKLIETEFPSKYQNLVPGQFPERLNGETGASRGMSLSPWMPPTYIWLAFEGLCGFSFEFDKVKIKPSIPKNWNWLVVENLKVKGNLIDAFIFKGKLYISGINEDKIEYNGEIVKIKKLIADIKSEGIGEVYKFAFEIEGGGRYIFIATDTFFEGEISIDASKFEVSLSRGDAQILRLS
jgi:hypothetical protein